MKKTWVPIEPDETVLAVVYRTLLPSAWRMVVLFVWMTAPFFFTAALTGRGWIGWVLFGMLVGSGMVVSWRAYVQWRHTAWIVTDRRVLEAERRGFFRRSCCAAHLSDIEDVSFEVRGIFSTLFRYGTVRIRLNGGATELAFGRVRNPQRVSELIEDARKGKFFEPEDAPEDSEDEGDLEKGVLSEGKETREEKLAFLAEQLPDDALDQLIKILKKKSAKRPPSP
ncbi:MAG TPA: PH domain-containing protein [Patescibacteria group bacterium]|nr:PH domain-containing protein [Patescibacteria group bacterium]